MAAEFGSLLLKVGEFTCMNKLTTLQVNDWLQKLAASSTENRVPPTGAPNAADTPDAAPPDTKSRISWSSRKPEYICNTSQILLS
jgi:hypothetical protein